MLKDKYIFVNAISVCSEQRANQDNSSINIEQKKNSSEKLFDFIFFVALKFGVSPMCMCNWLL